DLPRLQIDFVNVAALVRQIAALTIQRALAQIGKQDVVTPLAIERNERVRDAAVAADNQHLFAAVGMEQHQISAGVESGGMKDLGPDRVGVVAVTRLPDIHDVVVHRGGECGKLQSKEDNQKGTEVAELDVPVASLRAGRTSGLLGTTRAIT